MKNTSRRAKRMQRHQKRRSQSAGLNLVSLMDIFTILVFFLMVNSSDVEVTQNNASIKLPDSIAEQTPKVTLIISVNDDAIVVQGREIAKVADVLRSKVNVIPALSQELTYQTSRSRAVPDPANPGRAVTIMGDKEIPYQLLKKIMVTCAEADYSNISLAVNKVSRES